MTPSLPSFRRLVGGVVAFRDGERVGKAVRSLMRQELLPGTEWTRIWVVVSPDDAGTVASAREAALEDSRIEVLEETERRGKAAALSEITARAEGDLLVLLNGDAEAEPGSVAELVRAAEGAGPVFGVMARPVVPPSEGALHGALELLWRLHDRFHRELYDAREPAHLSDELFALPIAALPPFHAGIITDGAFAGAWIRGQRGELRYADRAGVRISLPASFLGHLEQRRRIRVGHRQVHRESGVRPETLGGFLFSQPRLAAQILREETRAQSGGVLSLMILLAAEGMAILLSRTSAGTRAERDAVWTRVALAPTDRVGDAAARDPSG